jgi:phosphoribosylamine---glycine ligase
MQQSIRRGNGEKIMIIGGGGFGGREHAATAAFLRSDTVSKVYVVPGSDALFFPKKVDERLERLPIRLEKKTNIKQLQELASFAREHDTLVYVGPENPLSHGIVDIFEEEGVSIVGPTQEAARLETSKAEAKDVMQSLGIPVPLYKHFTVFEEAVEYIQSCKYQVVVKADGLAEGKGSIVTDDYKSAIKALEYLMKDRAFGEAGDRVVIERRIYGPEFSFFLITDGRTILPMGWALDYKRARNFDQGLNTGGMGSYSPYSDNEAELTQLVMQEIAKPLIEGCRDRYGIVYKGIMYIGGVLVVERGKIKPYVFEINVRHGDPEAQVIYPRLKTDLAQIYRAVVEGRLSEIGNLEWDSRYHLCVCITSGPWKDKDGVYPGYPKRYKPMREIYGLENLSSEAFVFHNGTKWDEQSGCFLSTGGRVLSIVCSGATLEEAREKTYEEAKKVNFEGCYYRSDIGKY